MKPEILIYGLKQGETRDYMEDLLACFPVSDKAAASAQGFHSFRVTGFVPGTKPNFAKAVNV